MGVKDPRIDAYINHAADFAKPIIKRLRALVHKGCPDVVETVKWSHASFEHPPGSMYCGIASFKQHCTFGFWKHALVEKELGKPAKSQGGAWGTFGRISAVGELPAEKALVHFVKVAAELNERGVKVARPKPKAGRTVEIPADFAAALRKNRKAQAHFDSFSYSHRKEYVEWITEAKTEETRKRRLDTAVEWIAAGKRRNWKYERA